MPFKHFAAAASNAKVQAWAESFACANIINVLNDQAADPCQSMAGASKFLENVRKIVFGNKLSQPTAKAEFWPCFFFNRLVLQNPEGYGFIKNV